MGDVGLADGALGLAPRSKAGAGNRDRNSGVSGTTLSRALAKPMSRAWEKGAGQSARRNYRGSRHDDASPHKWGCAARPLQLAAVKGAGGEDASEVGMPPSGLTPPEQRAKFSPFEHRREQREADMRDGVGPRLLFQAKSLAISAIAQQRSRASRFTPPSP